MQRLETLRAILAESGFGWDLTGAPPEIPDHADLAGFLRRRIDEIQEDFPVTLAMIAEGRMKAPELPENRGRFDELVETLFELGVVFDGTADPPDLAAIEFDPPENRELAAAILKEMDEEFPQTIAAQRKAGFSLLPSLFEAGVHGEPGPSRPPRRLKGTN